MQRCPFCRSERVGARVEAREMAQASREPYPYLVCADCRSIRIAAIPPPIARRHRAKAAGHAGDRVAAAGRAAARVLGGLMCRPALRMLRPLLAAPPAWCWPVLSPDLQAFLFACPRRGARILDVGCGDGAFLAALHRLGFRRLAGIDPHVDPERALAPVAKGDIDDIDGEFDVILFNHSLERMAAPVAALQTARRMLAEGGLAVIHLANADSSEFGRWGGHWWGLHAPRHLAIPSRAGMTAAAEAAGLAIGERIATARTDNYLFSKEHSLGIARRDPQSWQTDGPDCIWQPAHLAQARRRALKLNSGNAADRVCYYLRVARTD